MLPAHGRRDCIASTALFFAAKPVEYLIAVWAALTGAAEIGSAIRLRLEVPNEWVMIIAGVLSIVFGVALAIFPGAGALALI